MKKVIVVIGHPSNPFVKKCIDLFVSTLESLQKTIVYLVEDHVNPLKKVNEIIDGKPDRYLVLYHGDKTSGFSEKENILAKTISAGRLFSSLNELILDFKEEATNEEQVQRAFVGTLFGILGILEIPSGSKGAIGGDVTKKISSLSAGN
ncbi:MAG: hypothetical protein JWM20_959 [Patescibacteria group bacterium]|nr:hypothetical protein [Patescibacteria group bacterium]